SSGGASNWQLPIEPPPGGSMESITLTGAACLRPGTSARMVNVSWDGCIDQSRTFRLSPDFRSFDVRLACFSGCEGGSQIWARDLATTLVDPVSPIISSLGGSLLEPG